MVGLRGKLTAQIEMRAGGDVFHDLFRHTPHQIPKMSPTIVQGCYLHEGERGKVGSIYFWNYTHEGKAQVVKELVEAIDEEKRSVTFKVVEGDLLQLYKAFKVTFHVETKGGIDLVTWTLEYEKLNDSVEGPLTLLGACIKLTKDIESHHV